MVSIYAIISICEVEEVIGGGVVLSHSIASDSVGDEEGGPVLSDASSIEVVDPPSLDNILPESTEHIVEGEVLVSA